MRELESQLVRLRQALLDMLSPAAAHPRADWLDWQERFHAVFLYLHQCALLAHSQVDPTSLLCPADSAFGSVEEARRVPEQLFRTKLDDVAGGCSGAVGGGGVEKGDGGGVARRARSLLDTLTAASKGEEVPSTAKKEPPPNDFTPLSLFYRGDLFPK